MKIPYHLVYKEISREMLIVFCVGFNLIYSMRTYFLKK